MNDQRATETPYETCVKRVIRIPIETTSHYKQYRTPTRERHKFDSISCFFAHFVQIFLKSRF